MKLDIMLSDYLGLKDELKENGVFDAIITSDSPFFINILRLKQTTVPEFRDSYKRINDFFNEIMMLLSCSQEKGDRLYKEALNCFKFKNAKGINLGFSRTGVDHGFGRTLREGVISSAFEIVKSGSNQPEIFHLVGLFEKGVGPDILSDMIASLILDDVTQYTKRINALLGITPDTRPTLEFDSEGIIKNPYKRCRLLYLPSELLHELPIADSWEKVSQVVTQNEAIRHEINSEIADNWSKLVISEQKLQIKKLLLEPQKCADIIEAYKKSTIQAYDPMDDLDYRVAAGLSAMKKSGVFGMALCMRPQEISSYDGAMTVLELFKVFVEYHKGWEIIQKTSTRWREKFTQRLIHNSGYKFAQDNNLDLSFEPDEGRGPCDLKVSRGNDKTVVEIKLSTNKDCFHGYDKQIEEYAKAEHTNKKIFVYVIVEERPDQLQKIYECESEKRKKGMEPPAVFVVDARTKKSASTY